MVQMLYIAIILGLEKSKGKTVTGYSNCFFESPYSQAIRTSAS